MAVLVCWILAAGSAWSLKASGAETEEMFQFQQEILDGIGLSDMDEAMRDILGEEPVSLESWVLMLLEGKLPLTKETMQKRIQDSLYGAWSQQSMCLDWRYLPAHSPDLWGFWQKARRQKWQCPCCTF